MVLHDFNAVLLIKPLRTNFCEILIEINTFSLNKMPWKMSSAERRLFCLGFIVLTLERTSLI